MLTIVSATLAVAGLLALLAPEAAAQGRHLLGAPAATKVLNCTACHGPGGNSESDSMPILAGRDPVYFRKQIEAYATGRRPSPEMEPYAKQVLEFGVDDIARYFAAQPKRPTPVRSDPAAVERGRAAARECAVCHGDSGKGDPAKGVPDLTGQPPGYLLEQIRLFTAGARKPEDALLADRKAKVMGDTPAARLADLAAYYSSLR